LHAFEGDARQIDAIKAAYGDSATVHQEFLFDGTMQKLYVASAASGMTSLLVSSTPPRSGLRVAC